MFLITASLCKKPLTPRTTVLIENGRGHGGLFLEQRPQLDDDVVRAFVVGDDFGEDLADLIEVGRVGVQKVEGSLGVAADGRQRLGDLVGELGGEFAHHGDALDVGEFLPLQVEGLFDLLALGNLPT